MAHFYLGAYSPDARPDTELLRMVWRSLKGAEGEVREVRLPSTRRRGPQRLFGTVSGYFDNEDRFVQSVSRITPQDAEAVYITLNPVNRNLLARASNRLEMGTRTATSDADIVRRTRLLIDIDPRRPAGISATSDEQAAAIATRDRIEAFLFDLLRVRPFYRAMTGNGGGLVYGIDLPNDATSLALITDVLKFLAKHFDDEQISIDLSVTNAGRITKVIGTVAAKGDDAPTLGRRWRLATAEFPNDASVVTAEQLTMLTRQAEGAVAASHPSTEAASDDQILGHVSSAGARTWSVEELLNEREIGFRADTKAYGTVYELEHCLTSEDHTDGSAIIELKGGALAYRCHHNSCSGRSWADARAALGLPSKQVDERSADSKMAYPPVRLVPQSVRPILSCVADVHPETVKWLVPGRIPLGKITVIEGDPGLGKSTLLADIAARVTRGAEMPDGSHGELTAPAGVIILSAEDGVGDTIRPRLEAAGADITRVFILDAVEEHHGETR